LGSNEPMAAGGPGGGSSPNPNNQPPLKYTAKSNYYSTFGWFEDEVEVEIIVDQLSRFKKIDGSSKIIKSD
jgi:hypothetical protein